MAGAGYKLFNTGDVLTAAQVNTYLQEQTVMVFASSAARTSALSGVLAEGMVSYLQDTNVVEVYNGSAWVGVSGAGDVTEVQAGTGISVASGTGPIPVVTNTMATAVDAKGDLIVGTGADTFSRLAVGANDTVLVAASGEATGLKWAAPAGGGMTLLSTTTLSSTTTTVNITPTGYVYLYFTINKMGFTGGGTPLLTRLNAQTGSNYCYNNRTRDNVFSKGSGQSSISSVNDYDNSDAQFVQGVITLPNATNQRPNAQILYYYNSAANQGFGQSWGAFESSQAAITSITFFSSNGTSTFANSPQLLIYGVK